MAAPLLSSQPKRSIENNVLSFVRSGAAESLSAQEILTWSVKNLAPRIALSCSFGAPEGLALLDMMHRIDPASRVFVLDTGRLPQETYDLIDRVRDRYDKRVEVVFPRPEAVRAMVSERGLNPFYESVESRQRCCDVRKVEPVNRYLAEADLDAWVTGLRRDQNVTRSETPKLELDAAHGGIIKVNPIADWTRDQVMEYVEANAVPTNRLHAAGYPSVGCAPCSRAVQPGDDPRSGRWWWESADTRECGLHVDAEDQGSGI
ncbi:MAG: phosphoadenylyl-sulfate reductase [Deltaproteobacteria bacterium]|nr:phosphoadenylyl-sulfate reductase [Deltaproteobacteria bacterium]